MSFFLVVLSIEEPVLVPPPLKKRKMEKDRKEEGRDKKKVEGNKTRQEDKNSPPLPS